MNNDALMIAVRPAKLTARGQTYDAFHGDSFLCNSRAPFYAAARKLTELGHSPDALLVMRHAGLNMDCMKGRLGDAAGLAVEETGKRGPHTVVFKPYPQKALSVSAAAA